MWGKVVLYYIILYYYIILLYYHILYRIDNGNCYIGGRMEIKIYKNNMGSMVVVGSDGNDNGNK